MDSSARRIARTVLVAGVLLVSSAAFGSPAHADVSSPTPAPNTDCFGNLLVPSSVIYASSGLRLASGGYKIEGTDGDDVIIGSTGNDVIVGKGGDDTVCGGDGDDVIYGYSLTTSEFVGTDFDHIDGENGNDTVFGGPDTDVIYGGHGDDKVTGDDGDDIIHGQGGSDALYGNDGADFIQCGTDGDTHLNPYTNDVGDYADGGIESDPTRPDVYPEDVGLVSDCETYAYIP